MRGSVNHVRTTDTVVIGAGQAGLAAARHLQLAGRDMVMLDAGRRVGDSWRHRWDSLRLFTPAGFSHLPDHPFPAPPRSFPTKDDMADYLDGYARRFRITVQHGHAVRTLTRRKETFLTVSDSGTWRSRAVIVATGAHHRPGVPALAADLHPEVHQLLAGEYRRPDQLDTRRAASGVVLVVGAGNTGAEIALDLVRAGRTTVLAGPDVGFIPRLGNPVFRLMRRTTTRTALGRQVIDLARSRGGDPLGRTRRHDLRHPLLRRVGRITHTRSGLPATDDETIAATTIIWATGYRPGFDWIDLPTLDDLGAPLHRDGLSPVPGLGFVGLPFQRTLASHLVGGVGSDARHVVAQTAQK